MSIEGIAWGIGAGALVLAVMVIVLLLFQARREERERVIRRAREAQTGDRWRPPGTD